MIEDMRMRKLSAKTQSGYICASFDQATHRGTTTFMGSKGSKGSSDAQGDLILNSMAGR
jgi:hypothetical protein